MNIKKNWEKSLIYLNIIISLKKIKVFPLKINIFSKIANIINILD